MSKISRCKEYILWDYISMKSWVRQNSSMVVTSPRMGWTAQGHWQLFVGWWNVLSQWAFRLHRYTHLLELTKHLRARHPTVCELYQNFKRNYKERRRELKKFIILAEPPPTIKKSFHFWDIFFQAGCQVVVHHPIFVAGAQWASCFLFLLDSS